MLFSSQWFSVQLVVLLQYPVMGEQSNSSDIVTDQPENNNQQIHHSSNAASSHLRLFTNTIRKEEKKKCSYIIKKVSLVNEPTYYTELQTFSCRSFKDTFISDLLLLWHEYFIPVVSSIAVAYFIFLCKPLLRVTCICLDE